MCRNLGVEGKTKTLWKELVTNDLLCYADLDPQGCKLINDFKCMLLERFNDLITGWVIGLDLDGSNRVDKEVFVRLLVSEYGYEQTQAHTLFRLLQSDAGKKYLNLSDIDVRAGHLYMNGYIPEDLARMRKAMLLEKSNDALNASLSSNHTLNTSMNSSIHSNASDGGGGGGTTSLRRRSLSGFLQRQQSHEILNTRRDLAKSTIAELNTKKERQSAKDMAAASKEDFYGFLRRRYKNIPRAWRLALDKDGNGKVNLSEFTHVCRDLKAYIGDIGTPSVLFF